jgi:hypothetical protein
MFACAVPLPVGQQVSLLGHFDTPVVLEDARPLAKPGAEVLRIQNPARRLGHAKKEIAAGRYFDVPAAAVEEAAWKEGR